MSNISFILLLLLTFAVKGEEFDKVYFSECLLNGSLNTLVDQINFFNIVLKKPTIKLNIFKLKEIIVALFNTTEEVEIEKYTTFYEKSSWNDKLKRVYLKLDSFEDEDLEKDLAVIISLFSAFKPLDSDVVTKIKITLQKLLFSLYTYERLTGVFALNILTLKFFNCDAFRFEFLPALFLRLIIDDYDAKILSAKVILRFLSNISQEERITVLSVVPVFDSFAPLLPYSPLPSDYPLIESVLASANVLLHNNLEYLPEFDHYGFVDRILHICNELASLSFGSPSVEENSVVKKERLEESIMVNALRVLQALVGTVDGDGDSVHIDKLVEMDIVQVLTNVFFSSSSANKTIPSTLSLFILDNISSAGVGVGVNVYQASFEKADIRDTLLSFNVSTYVLPHFFEEPLPTPSAPVVRVVRSPLGRILIGCVIVVVIVVVSTALQEHVAEHPLLADALLFLTLFSLLLGFGLVVHGLFALLPVLSVALRAVLRVLWTAANVLLAVVLAALAMLGVYALCHLREARRTVTDLLAFVGVRR